MDKVLEKAKELRDSIEQLPEFQEYIRLKKLVENDKNLENMRQDIARLASEEKYEERNNLLAIYNAHPLINNYNIAKEELKNILETVKDIISE